MAAAGKRRKRENLSNRASTLFTRENISRRRGEGVKDGRSRHDKIMVKISVRWGGDGLKKMETEIERKQEEESTVKPEREPKKKD